MDPSSLEARFAALEAEVRDLRSELAERPPAPSSTRWADPTAPTAHRGEAPTSRRRLLLGGAAAGAAVVAGSLAGARPAAATTGAMQFGTSNEAGTAATTLNGDPGAGLSTLAAVNSGNGHGLLGKSDVANGVYGISATGAAVSGKCTDGGFAGLFDNSTVDGRGVVIRSSALHLQFTTVGTRAAPTSDASGTRNTMIADSDGNLWYCVANGTPGTYRKLTGPTTAGSLHVLPAPVRAYDSRALTSPSQGPKTPLSGNTARTIDLTVGTSGVPVGATAALLTILLVNAANANGNATVWAAGVARPTANTLVWGGGAGRFTATATTAVDASARCQVAASATTDIVIDVVGYYR